MMKMKRTRLAAFLTACTMLSGMAAIPASAADAPDYADALKLALYFYDANECGTHVDENPLTWRGNCHTYDSEAALSGATGLGSSEIQVIKAQNGGKDTVDVSGGYHDAGDHIKSAMTMGFTGTSLAWSYYSYPDVFEQTGTKDHLFDILHTIDDYLMNVTFLNEDGSVSSFCYLVGDQADHDATWESPEKQTYDRKTYWATASHPSADAAGEMAACLASSSMALREVDAAYADQCMQYADALYAFAKAHPESSYDGIGSFYGSGSQQDDIAWADLWLHIAKGTEKEYTPISVSGDEYKTPAGTEYDGWIYSWDKVWGGYTALLAELGDATHLQKAQQNANLISNPQAGKYYFPKGGTEWGSSRYNCAWQMYALKYAKASGQTQYNDWAKTQMDYLLGQNPSGRSYLLGYTDTFPMNVHHRAANPNKNGMEHILYGALVGGETDQNGSYTDVWDSYSCTEPALDYEGCLVLALSGLCDANSAGDGSGADQTIAAAEEIDETHQFGTWYGSTPQQPDKPETLTEVKGDVTNTGVFEVTDIVALQKWLLGVPGTSLANWKAGDLYEDGVLDVFDLALMKRMLTETKS